MKSVFNKLIFLYFVLFPFGQLAKFHLTIGEFKLPVLLLDVVVGGIAILSFFGSRLKSSVGYHLAVFLFVCSFSWLVSAFIFKRGEVFYGLFYLLRLTAYIIFFIGVIAYTDSKSFKRLMLGSLTIVLFFTALFGWTQYVFYPDLTSIYEYGWDDHFSRLAGTFLDPGFTGIMLILGFLMTSWYFFRSKEKKYLILSAFMFISVLFTYSRASFLALLVGTFFLFRKNLQYFLIITAFMLMGTFLLPRSSGEGVKLERTASIKKRIINYKETFEIFRKNPLFGVGFNNLCMVRDFDLFQVRNHGCSGSDSSILFVLATTGVVGLMIFIKLFFVIVSNIEYEYSGLAASWLGALLLHSLFVGSLFYPHIMGLSAIFLGSALRGKK